MFIYFHENANFVRAVFFDKIKEWNLEMSLLQFGCFRLIWILVVEGDEGCSWIP